MDVDECWIAKSIKKDICLYVAFYIIIFYFFTAVIAAVINKNKNNDFIDTNVMETHVRKIRRSKLNASMGARNKNTARPK